MDTREQIGALVDLVFAHGSLYGAQPSRTLTVGGKRRLRIRLQSDICSAIADDQKGWWYYPDLSIAIAEAVAERRRS